MVNEKNGIVMIYSEQDKEAIKRFALTQKQGRARMTCPACSSERKNKSARCVAMTIYSDRVVYKCWHCEAEGAVPLRNDPIKTPARNNVVPISSKPAKKITAVKEVFSSCHEKAIAWLKSRGISEDTAKHFGVSSARAYFMQVGREEEGVAFPYFVQEGEAERLIGHKVRCLSQKDHVCKPALYSLFGQQHIDTEEKSEVVITEGEADTLAMYEAGVINSVSVPNGSSSFARNDGDDEKAAYGFLWTAKKHIDEAKRIVIACDADEPGDKLANELARRIGRHRCWRVAYPEGCKDANDVLLKHGAKTLKECVENAEAWPVDGIYEAGDFLEKVLDLYEHGHDERVDTGLDDVDEYYSVGKGLLTVVTGIPGHGKSTFIDQLMMNTSKRYGYVHAVCSFENPIKEHIGKLSQVYVGKHFFKTKLPGERMTREEVIQATKYIHKHFKFIHHEDGKKATLENIIERIETAVFRWGVNCVVIDPYNYIARPKDMVSETQWIDDMLTRLRLLAMHYGLHIWFIAHPTKLPMDMDGTHQIPKGYSISGSAAWYSKPDFGMTVYSTFDYGTVKINIWKVRFDWMGKVGEATILYDNIHHRYVSGDILTVKPEKPEVRYSIVEMDDEKAPF
jgi:twinkle protein